jgi:sulfite reductase (NADPH) flavoprotein alpha-component
MTLPPRAPLPSPIPESAPFSAEQRVRLNSLFAGLLSLEDGITPLSLEQAAALLPGALDLATPATGENDDGAPWHDPAMALADRMKLAEGRPRRRRMMAAMGQQDCGQCGYNCQDYSDAIFLQKEERLNLCVRGGKDTTRMLKALHQELGKAPGSAETPSETLTPAAATVALAAAPGCSRECPTAARFLSRTRLNKAGSAKETWHIEFDLTASGIDYAVGDVFGVFPTNDPAFVANLKKSERYQQDVY